MATHEIEPLANAIGIIEQVLKLSGVGGEIIEFAKTGAVMHDVLHAPVEIHRAVTGGRDRGGAEGVVELRYDMALMGIGSRLSQ